MTYYTLSKCIREGSMESVWFDGCILTVIESQSDADCACVTYAKYSDYISRCYTFNAINCRGWYITRRYLKKVVIK
jgi:hypothetical protein